MNLILVSIDSDIFDAHSYVRARMREYAKECERLEVVCVTRRQDARIVMEGNLRIHPIAGSRFFIPFLLLGKLQALVRELERKDTLISSQDPFFAGVVSLMAARLSGVPLHVQVHVAFFSPWYKREDLKHRCIAFLAGIVIPRADRIRTVSEKISAYCREQYHLPADRIDTIPLLVDVARIQTGRDTPVSKENDLRERYPQFTRIVLMACRLTPQKNIPLALRAFKEILAEVPGAGLVIVGRGEQEKEIRELIEETSLTDAVVLISWSDDVFSFMRSADVFLMSSDYEGYGMTVVEASAVGLPVVMTDVGAAGEFVLPEVNGLVVPVGNKHALVSALVRVLTDGPLHDRLSKGGLAQAKTLGSFETYRSAIAASWRKAVYSDPSALRLLFITQTVDRNDLPLSFVHTWIERLAQKSAAMTVITLNRGDYDLPGVEVLTLGKESGKGRFTYIYRTFGYAWTRRRMYDAVFVHMNQEYILLAGILWRLMGKRVYMWRNHYAGSWKTDIAALFCTKVFCTSKYSYTAKYKKTLFMPVGIDTERFYPDERVARAPRSILFFARITPAKRVDVFIEALGLLIKKGISFTASVYGSPFPKDQAYYESLKARVEALGLHDRVRFHPGVANDKAPDIFRAHEIFVNCSPSGMFDKMLFEAAGCGALVVASSGDYRELVDKRVTFAEGDAVSLSESLGGLLALSESDRERILHELKETARNESLDKLVAELVTALLPRSV